MDILKIKPIPQKKGKKLTGKWIVDTRPLGTGGSRRQFDSNEEAINFIEKLKFAAGSKLDNAIHWTVGDLNRRFQKDCLEDAVFIALGKNKNIKNKFRDIEFILDIKIGSTKFKNILVREVDTIMYKEYIIPVLAKGSTTKTAQNKHNSICLMFDEAVGYRCRLNNPLREKCIAVAGTVAPKETISPEDIYPEEIVKIINNAHTLFWRSAMSTAAFTGIRQGEQRALTWGNLILDDNPKMRINQRVVSEKVITIDEKTGEKLEYTDIHVKMGTKGGDLRKVNAKDDKRIIPIPAETASLLKEYKLQCEHTGPEDFVWSSKNRRFISDTRFGEALRSSIKKANVNPINWHLFRHYYASMLFLNYSDNIGKITYWMGHADEGVTRKVYRHWFESEEQVEEDRSNFNRLFSMKNPVKMTGTDDGFYNG